MRGFLAALGLWAVGACSSNPAAISAESAEEVGLVPQSDLIQGHDGGESAVLFGRSVWLYGDTPLNVEDVDGVNWHSNSFVSTDDLDASDGVDGFQEVLDSAGAPLPLVPNTEEERSFNLSHQGVARWAVWPGAAVFDAARARALIWYGLIRAEPGEGNFYGVGRSIAVWNDPSAVAERPIVAPGTTHPTLLFSQDERGYGDGAAIDGEHLYTFACDPSLLIRPCTLARVSIADVLERDAWTFWDGAGWSTKARDAEALFEGGLGMSVFRLGSHWVATYAGGPLSNDIYARTASTLDGPWSSETLLFTAKQRGRAYLTYDAYAHAELTSADEKTLYFSYTRGTDVGWFGSETVLVRVQLE